ncbi:hypothetical protein LXT12_07370 [Pelomonas sp. P7]|uniref:Uncharacterized protein n=1 Tax=Pelomonas caseinilytica TaxID=2906763 RepID=A0ABS8XF25_9BURK|nr:hypothetical protein [Pelomonas sp. P7]MCE4537066.1 hypothetical protein [Pelomonas sp. P7]
MNVRHGQKLIVLLFLIGFVVYVLFDPFADFEKSFHRFSASVKLYVIVSAIAASLLVYYFRRYRVVFAIFPAAAIGFGYFAFLVVHNEMRHGVAAVLFASFVWAEINVKAWLLSIVFLVASYLFSSSWMSNSNADKSSDVRFLM